MKRKNSIRRSGFTLIEVVVVIVILLTLATIATPLYMNYLQDANKKAAVVGMNNLNVPISTFRIDMGRYPTEIEELVNSPSDDEDNKWSGPYLEKVPKDPWGSEYKINVPGDEDYEYDIVCFGPDKEEGTDDDIVEHGNRSGAKN